LTAPTADDLRAWHRVQSAALAHDRPGEPVPDQEAVRGELTVPGVDSRRVLWLVRGRNGDAVATASLQLFSDPERARTADVGLTVHPAHRRLGAGSRLLATVVEAAARAGCRTLVANAAAGTTVEAFLGARGFSPALRLTHQRLLLDEVPERVRDRPDAPDSGYRLVFWPGAAPEHLIAGFARARGEAAATATGRLDLGPRCWDPARLRKAAEVVARRGERLLTVAALCGPPDGDAGEDAGSADGGIAGFTELVVPAPGAGHTARQYATAVLPAHRGNGLGLRLKAEMLRRLAADHPGITEVRTDTADDDRHMLAVNAALGFRAQRRTVVYRMRLPAR
jgi:GNAT superfamily N-acetyltransferase